MKPDSCVKNLTCSKFKRIIVGFVNKNSRFRNGNLYMYRIL
jgi:hypothetical protein